MWRRQLPAWSPITLRAIAIGAATPGGSDRNRVSLSARLRAEYGSASVQLTDSGTSALALAMLASAPHGTRPRVALPAWGCYDLMTAADAANAEVCLYDLDVETLSPERATFAAALEWAPSAVVIAHWFGLPVALESLRAQVHTAGALLVEDAAQGVGGSMAGRPLGSFGDFGVLSFGRGKGRTGGRGGALLANTPGASAALERVAEHVVAAHAGKGGVIALAAQWAAGRPWMYAIPSAIPSLKLGATIYHPAGPVGAMPEWSAATVSALWERSARESAARAMFAARWMSLLGRSPGVKTYRVNEGGVAGWLRFPVLAADSGALATGAARRLGIMPGYEGTLADLPVAPGRLACERAYPGAVALASRLRTLPNHSLVSSADVAAIVQLLEHGEGHRK